MTQTDKYSAAGMIGSLAAISTVVLVELGLGQNEFGHEVTVFVIAGIVGAIALACAAVIVGLVIVGPPAEEIDDLKEQVDKAHEDFVEMRRLYQGVLLELGGVRNDNLDLKVKLSEFQELAGLAAMASTETTIPEADLRKLAAYLKAEVFDALSGPAAEGELAEIEFFTELAELIAGLGREVIGLRDDLAKAKSKKKSG